MKALEYPMAAINLSEKEWAHISIYKRDYVIVTWLGHFFERICQLMT
jgi:hypothetical protein